MKAPQKKKRGQGLPFPIFFAISEALSDKQPGIWFLATSNLEAGFNQISVANISVRPYSWILAFVLCSPVVDQSCSALSVSAGLSGLHLAASGCRALLIQLPRRWGVRAGPRRELQSQSEKERTASAPLLYCTRTPKSKQTRFNSNRCQKHTKKHISLRASQQPTRRVNISSPRG